MTTATASSTLAGSHPDLSVIVLTYNRARLLPDCLDSLVAQTYPAERLEIVVADDGSSDVTPDVVAAYSRRHAQVRSVRHEHRGIPATRNLGLRHARGAIVAIVADDYILDPSYAERVVRFFLENADARIIRFGIVPARYDAGSRVSHSYYRASVLRGLAMAVDPAPLRRTPEVPGEPTTRHELDASGAAAFRREVFEQVGVFDESLARAEDSDLTVRLRRAGIPIHFDPNHPVRHQYDPYLRDTLVKSWLTGWYRYHHRRKNTEPEGALRAGSGLLAKKVSALRAALRAERSEGTTAWFVVGLPLLLLFEATNKAGFACSWLYDRILPKVGGRL